MNVTDFSALVLESANAGGRSWIAAPTTTGSGLLLSLVNRGLKSFTRATFGLYTFNQPIVCTAGASTISTNNIWDVHFVSVASDILKNHKNQHGPETYDWLLQRNLEETGQPTQWIQLPGKAIRLYPLPDATYSAFVGGWYEHPDVTGSDTVQIEPHLIDLAALWCSLLLKWPHAEGAELFNQLMALDQMAGQKIKTEAARNRRRQLGVVSQTKQNRITQI